MVRLTINGELREDVQAGNVAEMLSFFKLEQKILVVELNNKIIDRADYASAGLSDGDKIEIVHFVGGG